jgi:hypothetical protein
MNSKGINSITLNSCIHRTARWRLAPFSFTTIVTFLRRCLKADVLDELEYLAGRKDRLVSRGVHTYYLKDDGLLQLLVVLLVRGSAHGLNWFGKKSLALQYHSHWDEDSLDDRDNLIELAGGHEIANTSSNYHQENKDERISDPVEDVVVHEVCEQTPDPVWSIGKASLVLGKLASLHICCCRLSRRCGSYLLQLYSSRERYPLW